MDTDLSDLVFSDCLVYHPLLTNFFVNEEGGCDIKKACPIYHDDPQIMNRLKPCPVAWSDANGRTVSPWFGAGTGRSQDPAPGCFTLPLDWRATRFVVDQDTKAAPDLATLEGLRLYMAENPAYDRPWIMHECSLNGFLSYSMYNQFEKGWDDLITCCSEIALDPQGYPLVSSCLVPKLPCRGFTQAGEVHYYSFVAYALDLRPSPFNFRQSKNFNDWWQMLIEETFTWMPPYDPDGPKTYTVTVSGKFLLATLRRFLRHCPNVRDVLILILEQIPHGHIPLIETRLVNVGLDQKNHPLGITQTSRQQPKGKGFVFKPFQMSSLETPNPEQVVVNFTNFDFIQSLDQEDPKQLKIQELLPFEGKAHFHNSYRLNSPGLEDIPVISEENSQ
ncbi:MAG TPA: hypothetical protein DCW74_20965 [Alteromonas australica]|uniref:Uncharacterized protein n=1 Tax=Alteromonas australica TaxID=589873 RepID=A0A350PA79_9ALTE|nr:hypothetical protein [Alteromonas australica]